MFTAYCRHQLGYYRAGMAINNINNIGSVPFREAVTFVIQAIVKTQLNHNQVEVGLTTLWVL